MWPVSASQTFNVFSQPPVMMRFPSGLYATHDTSSLTSSRDRTSFPVWASHTVTFPLRLLETMRLPLGLYATPVTAPYSLSSPTKSLLASISYTRLHTASTKTDSFHSASAQSNAALHAKSGANTPSRNTVIRMLVGRSPSCAIFTYDRTLVANSFSSFVDIVLSS